MARTSRPKQEVTGNSEVLVESDSHQKVSLLLLDLVAESAVCSCVKYNWAACLCRNMLCTLVSPVIKLFYGQLTICEDFCEVIRRCGLI